MKQSALLLASIFLTISVFAQDPVKVLNRHRDSIPTEQLYMHFDKQAYVAGETAWFKAYVRTAGTEGFVSTNFFAELLNEKGEVLQSKKLPVVVNGSINGQFDIPATAPQGIYMIRAWTNYTRFFDATYLFKKALPVFNPSAVTVAPADAGTGYIFEWFPEGGKLLNGVSNVLAYRCMDKKMQPASVSGNLLNSKGEDLGSFSTNKYGLGYFSFPPAKGEKYFAELLFPDRSKQKIELPAGTDNGVALNVADHEEGKIFTLLSSPGDAAAPKEVLLLAVMNNSIVLKANVELKENEAQGLVSTANLSEGILRLYAFDKSNNLLAQRACYVTLESSHIPVEFKALQKGNGPKAFNEWSFTLPANTKGNFSISVTDADKELIASNEENIFTSLLTQPGRKQLGNMQVKDEEVRDLLMLTSSWVYDDWSFYAKTKTPKLTDELHLPFKGKIFEEGNNKLLTGGQLDILVRTKDSTDHPYTVPVMDDGSFKLYELAFYDTARIYYRWAGSKSERLVNSEIEFESENGDYSALLKNFSVQQWIATKKNLLNTPSVSLAAQLIADLKTTESLASRITLKQKMEPQQKNPAGGTKDVNNRYASGAFSSMSSARVVDLVTDPPSSIQGNILDYIIGRMSGFTIEKAGGRYAIYSSRSTSTREAISGNSKGLVAGKVFLDEQETTLDMISRLPLDQIAFVKYFAPGSIMLPGIGLSCVLSVYTRKPEDFNNSKKKYTNSLVYPGYVSGRTFTAPDYSVDDKKRKDNRSTLYWNPDVQLNPETNEIRIKFYNNDTGKRFHVVLEGVTNDGRLASFDKVVE
jgi:MG2 domain